MDIERIDIEPPRREDRVVYPCSCSIIYEGKPLKKDVCAGTTTVPDSPLCPACIESGHDQLPHRPYAEVAQERRGRGRPVGWR